MKNRTFFSPDHLRYVLFKADALTHIYQFAQRRWWQKEAGGEIYAIDPDSHGLIVTTACGPNPADRRGRHFFVPDIEAATRDRMLQFGKGRHAVGLWHTHPEATPLPSPRDRKTTEQYLDAFGNDRERYLMIILGNNGDPLNMTVLSSEKDGWLEWVEPAK